jgi:hypothetical protein
VRLAERAKHVHAFEDPGGGDSLAAGVRRQTDVRRQERGELGYAAAHDGRLKCAQQAVLRFPRRDVTNLIATDILTGSRDELSAGSLVHLQHRRDLRVGLVEDVMEEIGGAFLGREPF